MDNAVTSAFFGFLFGAFGYWITTFWVQPILLYRSVRSRIHSDLIYYAQVVNDDDLSDEMKNLYNKRVLANRKAAAELSAVCHELPFWYKFILNFLKIYPYKAASKLILYSNTRDYDESAKAELGIRQFLGLPEER